jgi:3'(2'), 5'-bisphosphate nucleotidase/myo-inositol-1(or 4)-monophosphatase
MTLEKYDIAFVGEESSLSTADSTEARFQKPYYWCVDPLDGTLPFVEGRAGYAVSIALVEQSGTPLIGVVYDPVSGTLIHAIKGQGAYLNNAPFVRTESAAESLKVYADRSFKSSAAFDRTVESLNACAQHLGLEGIELVYGNGAVKNACLVLQSAAACYLKSPKLEEGGGSIWDFAATACITKEAGGWASDSFGAALDLNHRDSTFMNHGGVLYASNETIARYLLENIALRP